jgi:hypothetical protein
MVKYTDEEKKALREAKPQLEKPLDLKMISLFFAKEIKQLKPNFLPEVVLAVSDDLKKTHEWVATDKWKDLVEYTLLPKEIAEKMREAVKPAENPGSLAPDGKVVSVD